MLDKAEDGHDDRDDDTKVHCICIPVRVRSSGLTGGRTHTHTLSLSAYLSFSIARPQKKKTLAVTRQVIIIAAAALLQTSQHSPQRHVP